MDLGELALSDPFRTVELMRRMSVCGLLKQADLPVDGLGRQVQPFTGMGNTPFLGNRLQIVQIFIADHRSLLLRELRI